jgi:hypothetical protein
MLARLSVVDAMVGGSRATARTSVPGWLLKGGTSTSWPVLALFAVSTPVHLRVVHLRVGDGTWWVWGRLGTLLGPEGTGAPRGVRVSSAGRFLGRTVRLCPRARAGVNWCSRLASVRVCGCGWVGAGCGGGSRP